MNIPVINIILILILHSVHQSCAKKSPTPQADLDKALKAFSLKLKPTTAREIEGRAKANEIFEDLRQKSRYGVDRCYIGGSSGKKTGANPTPDLDLVIFVNKLEPPFTTTALADFATLLVQKNVTIVKKWKYSLQLKVGDFDIDLLAASNEITGVKPPFKILAARQALAILEQIQKNSADYYRYSTSLAETQLEFVKEQSAYVHDLIRVCKFWNFQIKMNHFGGRSALIELIAVKAGQEVESKSRPSARSISLLEGFYNFLNKMEAFGSINIAFKFDPLGPIRNETSWRPSVSPDVKRPPFVIEPANPFNNMARPVSKKQVKRFKKAARNTKIQLAKPGPWTAASVEKAIKAGTSDVQAN